MEDDLDLDVKTRRRSSGNGSYRRRTASTDSGGGGNGEQQRPAVPTEHNCSALKERRRREKRRAIERLRKTELCLGHDDSNPHYGEEVDENLECGAEDEDDESSVQSADRILEVASLSKDELCKNIKMAYEEAAAKVSHIGITNCFRTTAQFLKDKNKLNLEEIGITMADIPTDVICDSLIGSTLYKLSLAGNCHLASVPERLVGSLPILANLDLSRCGIHQLPGNWHLPKLKCLDLSHNFLVDFPEESIIRGLPELKALYLQGNKIVEIVIPENNALLSELILLDMAETDLERLPDELDKLVSLKTLKLNKTLIKKVPMRVCAMKGLEIDISENELLAEPPLQYCNSGTPGMLLWYLNRSPVSNDTIGGVSNSLGSNTNTETSPPFSRRLINPFNLIPNVEIDEACLKFRDPNVDERFHRLLGAVVLVGLWDEISGQILKVGSGFFASRTHGLVVTASHTLINMYCDDKQHEYWGRFPFGKDNLGLPHAKIAIGVIPKRNESDSYKGEGVAVFRYLAKIVAKDPNLEKGQCRLDACVLKITDRFKEDVDGEGEDCRNRPYAPLLRKPGFETLDLLSETECVGCDDDVVVMGYGQRREDLLVQEGNVTINRFVHYVSGNVCDPSGPLYCFTKNFNPRGEIAITTIFVLRT